MLIDKDALKQMLLSTKEKHYDPYLGLLLWSEDFRRTWLVPFGLATRCWPASHDSPVMLVQMRNGFGGEWFHTEAFRVTDGIHVEPPFDAVGRAWALCTTDADPEDGDVLHVFSCRSSAEAAVTSAPKWVQDQLELREVYTYTPWRAPRSGHPIKLPPPRDTHVDTET